MPARSRSSVELAHVVVRERLPDAEREAVAAVDAREDRVRAEPAVLVVDRGDAALVRELDPRARRVDELVLGDDDVAVAEAPRRLLAQDARRLAGAVALDDAPVDVQVAPGAGEPRGVDPERVVVLRPERRRSLARDRVERLARGVLRPERVAPATAADPSPRRRGCASTRASVSASEAAPSSWTSRCDSDHVGKWTCASVKAGRTQRPRRSTRSGVGRDVSCVPTPPAMRSPAIASAAVVGSDGSIVRTTPFEMITGESLRASRRVGGSSRMVIDAHAADLRRPR